MKTETIHNKLISVTKKWWFSLIVLLLFFIPSYTNKPLNPEKTADLVITVLSKAIIYTKPLLFPVFKIALIIILFILFKYRNKVSRILSGYAAFNFLVVSIFQNMAHTQEYGFAILIGNLIVSFVVTAAWIWEIIVDKNNFKNINFSIFKFILITLAFIAYWYPINMTSLKPDFNLLYIFTSESGLTFCMLIPIYLTILILIYPKVNYVTLKVTSLVGFITGVLNIIQFFILNSLFWMGILHLPQLIIAFYGLVLSRKEPTSYNSKVYGSTIVSPRFKGLT